MDPLVNGSLLLRRAVRRGHGLALAALLGAAVSAGIAGVRQGGDVSAVTPALGLCALVWGALLASRVASKFRRITPPEGSGLVDVEIGVLLAVGLDAALLRLEGGFTGPLSPAVYVLVALVAAFAKPLAGLVVVFWVIGLEAALRTFTLKEPSLDGLVPHAGFVLAFGVLSYLFLRAEVARVRRSALREVEGAKTRLKEDARSYRLLGAGGRQGEGSEERLARSSVEEIHESLHYALELLRRTLDCHTAVLLWLNDGGTHLRISELSTESDDVNDAPFLAGDGVLGVVVAKKEKVTLTHLRPSYKVPYYAGPNPVKVLLALPVLEDGQLRGVLAIDRVDDRPFTERDEELVAQAARYCLRAIQNERVFVQLERAKVEQGKLYRAAEALGKALSEKDVLDAGVKAAREIASFDFAAVTIYDHDAKTHEVCAAKGADGDAAALVGLRFAPNAGLVSMVVQNKFPLPYKGEYDPTHQIVLTKRAVLPKLASLLVLPLVLHDRPLGTLILGAKRRHAFGDAVRPTLEVLASHLAVSLSNARMVAKLETMATTDGLTGLLNKRAMLDAATQKVGAAARFGRKLSVLITDIDFFKKVNDTHGHDVGDVVIKGLGEILKRQKRSTDVVARFGGEEFVILCEETDPRGAMLLAERIREELERTTFQTPNGPLTVTGSLGVATFPEAGKDWDALFKSADEALYVSKRSGRNRSTAWTPSARTSQAPAPSSPALPRPPRSGPQSGGEARSLPVRGPTPRPPTARLKSA